MVQKYDRYAIQEPETETNLAVSVASGIGSGLIKIPLGLASVAAEVYDAVKGEGQNIEDGAVARLEQFIDDSVVGDVIQGLEDKARDTAAGRITRGIGTSRYTSCKGRKNSWTNSIKNNYRYKRR